MTKLRAWAIIGTDAGDGLWAYMKDQGDWYPLLTMSQGLVPSIQTAAEEIARQTGKSFRLVTFEEIAT